MRARRTHDSNFVYSLPGGNEDNDLWVERKVATAEDLAEGDPCIGQMLVCSVWELDDEERAAIANGENIRLTIVSGQPPVSLAVVDTPLGKAPGEQ